MAILTVTAEGQVTLRKEILRHLGIQPGDEIDVAKLPDGRLEVRAARLTGRIEDIFGMFDWIDGPTLSIEDIKRATSEAWAGER